MDVEGVVWWCDDHNVFLLDPNWSEIQLAVAWGAGDVRRGCFMQNAHQMKAMGGIALLMCALQLT